MALVSVTIAVACFVGSITLLNSHNLRTEQIVYEKEREVRMEMLRMEDDYRQIMRDMGYML